jgi:hypothetical protein
MQSTAVKALITCAVALAVTASAAAEPASRETFSEVETIGPETITDLPCFEGREFTLSGTIRTDSRITRNSGQAFSFAATETFNMTLVPTDGLGPTYVEDGVERTSFTANEHNTVFNLTVPFQDTFVAYDADGNRLPGQTIRIQGVSRLLVEYKDTNPDAGSRTKVDFERVRLDCP